MEMAVEYMEKAVEWLSKAQGAKLKPEIITYKVVIDASAKSTVLLSMHGDGCRVVIRWHFKT